MTQKEKTFLDQTAQRLHLTVDGESSILFGSVGGYQTMLWRNDQGLAVMTLSLHKLGQEPDQSAIRQFVKGTRLVTGVSVRRSRVELTLNVRFGNPNQVEKLAEAVAAVVEFLHASGYDNCCQNCGSAVETDPCIMTYVGYQLDWSVAVYNELKDYYELSLLDCFRMIPEMLRQEIIDSSTYIGELVKLYAFTLLGAIPTAISSMRSRKLKKVTYRLRSQRTNAAPEL